jgi:hypothetical protein
METMFYDEPTLLTTVKKTSMSLDNTSLKLNLCPDGKNLDIATKRDELAGFGDLADFLVSPDIGISSPDLENLVWKEWSGTLKASGGLTEQQTYKQEHCDDQGVTKEQEVFAYGFTEALKKLQQTEQRENEVSQEEIVVDSSECSDAGSQDDSSSVPENCDAKITFISYTFDSKEPLPSFQEAFSKIIIKKSKELEFCLQIKMEASEEVPVSGQEKANSDDEFKSWDVDNDSKDVWDRVETVDEGFCTRDEVMPVDLERNNYLEDSGISDCAINPSLSWEHSNDLTINNRNLYKEKSAVDRHFLGDFSPSHYSDENYIDHMGSIDDMGAIDDSQPHKQWITTHGTL